jgi:hypothetical protein
MSELEDQILPSPERRYFNVQRCGGTTTIDLTRFLTNVSPEYRWQAQRMLAEMRFQMLKLMIDEGYIPCKPYNIELTARMMQDALPDEVLSLTEGRRLVIPDDQYSVVTLEFPSYRMTDWLPFTDKERGFNGS